MSNVVNFTGKKPEAKAGPYWAGEPMEKAFPGRKFLKPGRIPIGRVIILSDGDLCFLDDDGPEGAA